MRSLAILLAAAVSVGCFAQPRIAFYDTPQAVTLGGTGTTSVFIVGTAEGIEGSIVRAVAPWLDVSASFAPSKSFELSAKALVVRDWVPLQVAVEAGLRRRSLLAVLLLGPIHLDAGRTWGDTPRSWAAVGFAANERVALVAGIDAGPVGVRPLAGIRWYPWGTRRWGLSVQWRGMQMRLGVGGCW